MTHATIDRRRNTLADVTTSGLDGSAPVARSTLLLVSASLVGSLLFTTVYLLEGVTRPGYVAYQQAISALSLGPGGWMQRANFIVFGLLILCSAVGWRRLLRPGVARVWFPIAQTATGIGLIVDGIVSQNPAPGYPVGATLGAPTVGGAIHTLFAVVSITSLALGCFVLARRFAREPRWRGWALYSVITGLLTIVFIALFGMSGAHGGIAGIYERLSAGVHSLWSLLVIARLFIIAKR